MKSNSRLKVYWPSILVVMLFIQSHYISIVKSMQYFKLYKPLFELVFEYQSIRIHGLIRQSSVLTVVTHITNNIAGRSTILFVFGFVFMSLILNKPDFKRMCLPL